jgi:hypothetical protein
MDITILTAIILAGIALESFISERARGRARVEDTIPARVARFLDRDVS